MKGLTLAFLACCFFSSYTFAESNPIKLQFKLGDLVIISAHDIDDAFVGEDSNTHEWFVGLKFNFMATKRFARITKANIGKNLSIIVDGKVLSTPIINAEIERFLPILALVIRARTFQLL